MLKSTSLIILLTVANVCLSCHKVGELIEFKVISCEAVPVNIEVHGYRYSGKHDLNIFGLISHSIPIKNHIDLDYGAQQKNLSIIQKFVYEERNGQTCKDFANGETKVMYYEGRECILIKDNEVIKDVLCGFSDKKVSDLPFSIQKLLVNFN